MPLPPPSRFFIPEEGKFEQYGYYPKNPELVLVDTTLLAKAPAKLLTFGIADGLATYVEARAVAKSGAQNLVGGRPTFSGSGNC